jgi:alpha-beta hydrolase superfamily lysophospholipase
VLHGNADTYCDWQASKKFVEGIASKDNAFGIYDEERHEPFHDLEGNAVVKRMMVRIECHM